MAEIISEIELGKIQDFGGMYLVPLYTEKDGNDYLTLKEAMGANLISISELDQQGRVPELRVFNMADIPVIILDGEEVCGAKQNRVLNTTILLKENSETIIPVSCTEQGRWRYTASKFSDSGVVAASRLRQCNMMSVKESLRSSGEYKSNQMAVWNAIEDISNEAMVYSETRALRDVYQDHMKDLDEYLESFPCLPSQKGIMIILDGKIVGLDLLSSSNVFKLLHEKLVKSYAMEALFKKDKSPGKEVDKLVAFFLDDIKKSSEIRHPSVGYGCDHRFESKLSVGSSLVYQNEIIHVAFFSKEDEDKNLSSYQ